MYLFYPHNNTQELRQLKCDIFSCQLLVDSCERLQLREREGGDGGKGGERERGREKGGLLVTLCYPMVNQLSIYLLIYQTLTKSTRLYVNICVSECDEILTQYIHVRTSKQHMSLPCVQD